MTPAAPTRSAPLILIVEDDVAYAARLAKNLGLDGFETEIAHCAEEALTLLGEQSFDLVLADISMPRLSGLDLLDKIVAGDGKNEVSPPPVVILTSIGGIDTVVDAMRRGASDYLSKESTREEISIRLRKSLREGRLAIEVRHLRRSLARYQASGDIVGVSPSIDALKKSIEEIAPSDVTVLISGETGSGKEMVARAIHRASARRSGPFIEVNCAALPDENLFLSELFGHEKGAFTGAISRKRGHFELAEAGTLFLDEVAELGPMAQARLLRVVETLQFNRVGGERVVQADCRLIFATNKELEREVEAGRFRQDLFYRINVCPIAAPALRARPEDVPVLARFFAARAAEKHHLAPITLDDEALAALRANPWPGNVRELANVIERLSIRFSGRPVGAEQLRALNLSSGDAVAAAIVLPDGGVDLQEVERGLVLQALQRSEWSQRKAAKLLSISVDRMNARVKKFSITHPSWRVHKG